MSGSLPAAANDPRSRAIDFNEIPTQSISERVSEDRVVDCTEIRTRVFVSERQNI